MKAKVTNLNGTTWLYIPKCFIMTIFIDYESSGKIHFCGYYYQRAIILELG